MLREAQLVGVGLITVVLHACFLSVCVAKHHKYQICSPSSCGDMQNISYPFRLQGDPPSCGYPEYELICENNRTMINLYGGKYCGKYLVTQINYHNYTIGVVDPGQKKDKCWISSPLHSIAAYYIEYGFPYYLPSEWTTAYIILLGYPSRFEPVFYTVVLMKCKQSISDDKYIPIIPCVGDHSSSSPEYAYALVGDHVSVGDIPYACTMGSNIIIQPLKALPEPSNLSMSDLQDYLLLGLQLSFMRHFCHRQCEMKGQVCYYTDFTENAFQCQNSWDEHIPNTTEKNWLWKFITINLLQPFIRGLLSPYTLKHRAWPGWFDIGLQEELGHCSLYHPCNYSMIGRTLFGILCLFAYLIYKFHRRHLLLDDS